MFDSRSQDIKSYNQQQNLNTLIQVIGLRSQPTNISVIKMEAQDLVNFNFGKQFVGLHNVWRFDFVAEHTDVYNKGNDPIYFLKEDNNGVAFIGKLDETANFTHNLFQTFDDNTLNLYFMKL